MGKRARYGFLGSSIYLSFSIIFKYLLVFSISSFEHPGITYPTLVLAKLFYLSFLFKSALKAFDILISLFLIATYASSLDSFNCNFTASFSIIKAYFSTAPLTLSVSSNELYFPFESDIFED